MPEQLRLPLLADREEEIDVDYMRALLASMGSAQIRSLLRRQKLGAERADIRVLVALAWEAARRLEDGRSRRRLLRTIGSYLEGVLQDLPRAADAYAEAINDPNPMSLTFTRECLEERAILLLRAGFYREAACGFDKLRRLTDTALTLRERADMELALAERITSDHGFFQASLSAYTQAAAGYRALGDLPKLAETLVLHGEILRFLGDPHAIPLLMEGRRLARGMGDERRCFDADQALADIFWVTGRWRRLLGASTRAYRWQVAWADDWAAMRLLDRARALDRLGGRQLDRDWSYRLAIHQLASIAEPSPFLASWTWKAGLEFASCLVRDRRYSAGARLASSAVIRAGTVDSLRGRWFGRAFSAFGGIRASAIQPSGLFPSPPVFDHPPSHRGDWVPVTSVRLLLHLGQPVSLN